MASGDPMCACEPRPLAVEACRSEGSNPADGTCEASWWADIMDACESDGDGHLASCAALQPCVGAEPLWSGDSGDKELSSAFGYGCCSIQDDRGGDLCPGYADLGGWDIPCMAGELLQHILANEQMHLSPTCSTGLGAFSLAGSLSSSQLSSLCCAKSPPATPEITDMLTPPPTAASHPALELASVASFVSVDSFQAAAKHAPLSIPEPELEQHDYLSTGSELVEQRETQQVVCSSVPSALAAPRASRAAAVAGAAAPQRNSLRVRERRSPVAGVGWRGCAKSAWCNRENRHRGVCNTRATLPGVSAACPAAEAAADNLLGLDSLTGAPSGEDSDDLEEPDQDRADSEQASATEFRADCRADCQEADTRWRVDKQPPPQRVCGASAVKQEASSGSGKYPFSCRAAHVPQTPPPLFPSRTSAESSHFAGSTSQRECDESQDTSSLQTGGAKTGSERGDHCESGISIPVLSQAADVASTPATPTLRCTLSTPQAPKIASGARASSSPAPAKAPPTPFGRAALANALASPGGQESLKPSAAAPAPAPAPAPAAPPAPAPPPPPGRSGFVQTSSGRIARPTPKTAASRASSAELTDLSNPEGRSRAAMKRKGGRPAKVSDKAVKRRRMVGGVLKHIGTAAPGQQCTHCGTQVTPVWRAGPYGPKTLCNACGVRYMKQVKKK